MVLETLENYVKPRQLDAEIATLARVKPSQVRVVHEELGKLGMLTKGARGRNAPDVSYQDAIRMVLGIAVAQPISHAGRFMPDLVRFKVGHDFLPPFMDHSFAKGTTIEELLEAVMTTFRERRRAGVVGEPSGSVRVNRSWPWIDVELYDGAAGKLADRLTDPNLEAVAWPKNEAISRLAEIDLHLLLMLANAIDTDDPLALKDLQDA